MKITVDFDYNGIMADGYETYRSLAWGTQGDYWHVSSDMMAYIEQDGTVIAEIFFQPDIYADDFSVCDLEGGSDAQNDFTLREKEGKYYTATNNEVEFGKEVVSKLYEKDTDDDDEPCFRLKEEIKEKIKNEINEKMENWVKENNIQERKIEY